MWKRYRQQRWPIISTWIDEAGPGETDDFFELWLRIHREISQAAGVVLYAEADDFPLKGAYVEVGICLGLGKPVGIVLPNVILDSDCRPIGSWIKHPLVTRWESVEKAMRVIGE
jgi:hypothetical protein